MRALTIDGIWAWAIMAGHKRVENRSWRIKPGPLAIHAGLARKRDAAARAALESIGLAVPPDEEIPRGVLLGTVEVVDAVDLADYDPTGDPLAAGPIRNLLADPRPFPEPIPAVGRQGLWNAAVE